MKGGSILSNSGYNILVVDDDQSITNAITIFLKKKGYHIFSTCQGHEGIEIVKTNTVHLVILDIMMPTINGINVLSKIRSISPTIPVIMLTALSEEWDKEVAFNHFADDYMTKPFSLKELELRIAAILRRCNYQSNDVIIVDNLKIDSTSREVYIKDKLISLTKKEFDLLYILVSNESLAFTRDMLLSKVWSEGDILDHRTVDSHIRNLRKNLEEYSECIKTIWGVGYKFESTQKKR